MLDQDVTVTKVTEQSTYGANLKASVNIRVEFMVGDHGPFVEKFPKDTYTAIVRDDRLNTFAREVR